MGELERGKLSNDGVIVTVYEESHIVCKSIDENDKVRVTKSRHRTSSSSFGLDRRADLLAYANQLRSVGSQQAHQEDDNATNFPTRKSKKRRRLFGALRKLPFSIGRLFGQKKHTWRYESINPQGYTREYRSHQRGRSKYSKMSKRISRFLKKLPWSWGWKCNKKGL